ncbi:response regulator transcription factor [candidate division KSB1 bacterium]|nr:response regulator transcription factor [candidate division KSB1 bacterium]
MPEIKILIVDDEQPARKKLAKFCKQANIDSIFEATNGLEAVELIQLHNPDLVFLDIQMPGMTGFEVIEAIQAEKMPIVVFVTAYDQYAINAFEVQAIDYLLKPFDQERFQKAFDRAFQQLQLKQRQTGEFEKLLQLVNQEKKYLQRILVNSRSRFFFIPTKEICYISAEEKYVQLHMEKDQFLVREAMLHLEKRLDPEKFARIHRSYIINLDFIKEIQPWSHGDCMVILKNGNKLPLSRRFRDKIFQAD